MGTMSEVVTSRPPAFEKKTSGVPPTSLSDKQKPCPSNSQTSESSDKSNPNENIQPVECFGPYFRFIPTNGQVKELQTIIRDKNTSRSDFKFYADRLVSIASTRFPSESSFLDCETQTYHFIPEPCTTVGTQWNLKSKDEEKKSAENKIRLVVEEGLNQLPYSDVTITTPTGCSYKGLQFVKGNCGVSIVRSGEAMEQGLRSCCRSIRLGKILVESDLDTHEAKVVYAKFPEDISQRKVLLMYPIMSSGNTVIKAVNVLQEHAVDEANIILLNLFSTPAAARTITSAFPKMHILTTEVHPVAPNHFGQKYFGTD